LTEFTSFIQGAWLNTSGPIAAFVRSPKLMREAETALLKLVASGVTVEDAEKIRGAYNLNDIVKGLGGLEDFSLVLRSIFRLLDRVYTFSTCVRKGLKRLLVAVISTVVMVDQGDAAAQYDEEDRAIFYIIHLSFAQLAWLLR